MIAARQAAILQRQPAPATSHSHHSVPATGHNLHVARQPVHSAPASSFSLDQGLNFGSFGSRRQQHHQVQLNSLQGQSNLLLQQHQQQSHLLQQQVSPIFQQQSAAVTQSRSFIGPAPAPAGHYSGAYEQSPVITVTDDAVIAVDAPAVHHAAPAVAPVLPPGQCPAPTVLPHHCAGAVNQCWSIGVSDVDCPGHSLCCFDGCSNYCLGHPAQAPALAPAVVVPAPNPAQTRVELSHGLEQVIF